MKVSLVVAGWSTVPERDTGWVLMFKGGSLGGVPMSPAPEWKDADRDLDEEDIRAMAEATAAWEGIPLTSNFRLEVMR